jgi:hypothetical protein
MTKSHFAPKRKLNIFERSELQEIESILCCSSDGWPGGRSLLIHFFVLQESFIFLDSWVSVKRNSIGPVLMAAWRDCAIGEECNYALNVLVNITWNGQNCV